MFTDSICARLAAIERVADKMPSGLSEEDIQDPGEIIRDAIDETITTIVTRQVGESLDLEDTILETQDIVWQMTGITDWSHPGMPNWLTDTTNDVARAISRRNSMRKRNHRQRSASSNRSDI
jgi:hypothetical protein